MRILLIGNFAPPYEEENLYNISLLMKLEADGHECTVMNISEHLSCEPRFIDTKNNIDYLLKLIRHSRGKDIIHFSTKGYLRVGLLKMMMSIFAGMLFRTKRIITFHSELFSMLGQMRSPFGGTQTLNTSFYLADKIIYGDKDTFDAATMYQKKSNFEMIPSFVYVPDSIINSDSSASNWLKDKKKVIVLSNVSTGSFLFEILKEILTPVHLPSDTGLVISFSDNSDSKLHRAVEERAVDVRDRVLFIEPSDTATALLAYSRADLVLRPLSCDGETFFETFTMTAKTVQHIDVNHICFPSGLVFVKEGSAAKQCAGIANTILNAENVSFSDLDAVESYSRIKKIYEE